MLKYRWRGWTLTVTLMGSLALIGCGGGSSEQTAGGENCEVVSEGSSHLRVTNALSTGLKVYLGQLAFGALMRPGVCEIIGMPAGNIKAELTRCTFSSDSECVIVGSTKIVDFSVGEGDTYDLVVTEDLLPILKLEVYDRVTSEPIPGAMVKVSYVFYTVVVKDNERGGCCVSYMTSEETVVDTGTTLGDGTWYLGNPNRVELPEEEDLIRVDTSEATASADEVNAYLRDHNPPYPGRGGYFASAEAQGYSELIFGIGRDSLLRGHTRPITFRLEPL